MPFDSGKKFVQTAIPAVEVTTPKVQPGHIDVEMKKQIEEINKEKQEVILLEGGKGGLGNSHFKSPINQTPRYSQSGLPGQELQITLELKILADVGLVGYPNVGKSTLLSVLSDAKPKIADYEFTTLKPNLGIVSMSEYRSFVMADIPGIIEGASDCLLYTSPSPRDVEESRMPSSA